MSPVRSVRGVTIPLNEHDHGESLTLVRALGTYIAMLRNVPLGREGFDAVALANRIIRAVK